MTWVMYGEARSKQDCEKQNYRWYEDGASAHASVCSRLGWLKHRSVIECENRKQTDDFFNLKNDVIHSHEEFVNRWLQGLRKEVDQGSPAYTWIYTNLRRHPSFRDYVLLFLRRSYLKHFEELSKKRPFAEEPFYGLVRSTQIMAYW
jgi:hypothetical protein